MLGMSAAKRCRVSFTLTNVDNTAEQEVNTALIEDGDFIFEANKKYALVHHSTSAPTGSAATYEPALGEATGFAAGDIEERFSYKTQPTSSALSTNIPGGILVKCDADGSMWYQPRFDANNDNDVNVVMEFELVHNN